jgi:hypothetical protein
VTSAAITPVVTDESRMPMTSTTSALATATAICASPTTSHERSSGQ